jgi:sulfur-carrier protein
MRIEVLYFAALRDLVGVPQESVELEGGAPTLATLIEQLLQDHPDLRGYLGAIRFAVNETFVDEDAVLDPEDTVALIPPVSGG